MTEAAPFEPDWISPPGETIEDALEERGWTQVEFAERLGMSRKYVNELVKGHATLSAETALQLSIVLGSTADFWLRMEAGYRAQLATRHAREALRGEEPWLDELPLAYMVKHGWVAHRPDKAEQVQGCLAYFGVANVAAWRVTYEKPLAAFRASDKFDKKVGAVAAWLRQAEREAAQVRCEPFHPAAFKEELQRLRSLTSERDPKVFAPELVARCARHGVAVVFVPAPPGCPASGATKWLTPEKALLVLSLRHKTDDHLWFSFFHEGFHLVLHGKKLVFIEGLDGLDAAHEHEANVAAANLLIPPAQAVRLAGPWPDKATVVRWAQEWGIAPGIIVGRMQHQNLLPQSHLNGLKVRYTWAGEDAARG